MTTYFCDDGNAEITIEADSAQDAAQEYVDDGEWNFGDNRSTAWVTVMVWEDVEDADVQSITIEIEPPEPDCDNGTDTEHEWEDDGEPRGDDNGGIASNETCKWCGLRKVWRSRPSCPDTGQVMDGSTTYKDPVDGFSPRPKITEAEKLAEARGDGMDFDGLHDDLDGASARLVTDHGCEPEIWQFDDGSAIVIAGDGWDVEGDDDEGWAEAGWAATGATLERRNDER